MKIALASPPFPSSLQDGLDYLREYACEASLQKARIICFPESFLPGYPGMGYSEDEDSPEQMDSALREACKTAKEKGIGIILPMNGYTDSKKFNLAQVISSEGKVLGSQTKNQLDPSEDQVWDAGTVRQVFEMEGLRFGITICHEGFRYPESVRWCARQGAQLVFHPHYTGSNTSGPTLRNFGSAENPYYEKAMQMRALENTIYFASVNYASAFPESASALIAPDGTCLAHQPYRKPGILVLGLDLTLATGLLAKRFKPEMHYP